LEGQYIGWPEDAVSALLVVCNCNFIGDKNVLKLLLHPQIVHWISNDGDSFCFGPLGAL